MKFGRKFGLVSPLDDRYIEHSCDRFHFCGTMCGCGVRMAMLQIVSNDGRESTRWVTLANLTLSNICLVHNHG